MDAAQAATKLTAISRGTNSEGGGGLAGTGFGIEQQHEACSLAVATFWLRNLAHC